MGLLYDANYQGITCVNGMVMKLRHDWQRGYYWRCTRNNCCGKSRTSVLEYSFFAEEDPLCRSSYWFSIFGLTERLAH
ncbi:hypothetical protein PS15m_011364 [Mucor circinelloides]